MSEILWIAAIIIFSVTEALTAGLVSIWFAFGAAAGLISAFVTDSIAVQAIVFAVVSAVSFLVLRNLAVKAVKTSREQTDIGRIIGKEIMVTQTVDNSKNAGKAKINDVEWKLKSSDGRIINEGQTVTVEKIEGVKLVVKG